MFLMLVPIFKFYSFQGTFRLTCEKVLSNLRNCSETLLTLLQAFVYDPPVEWTIGEEKSGTLAVAAYGGEALGAEMRQANLQMEHELLRDTLNLEFEEMRPEWTCNRFVNCAGLQL